MNPTPRKLVVMRKKVTVRYRGSPLLTKDDRKIHEHFVCKVPVNKVGSWLAFCGGFAAGMALVLSGPVGWVIAGAAAVVVISTAIVAASANPCAGKLESEISEWFIVQPVTKWDGAKAITKRSLLKCENGGILNPMIDPVLAEQAAVSMAWANWSEFGVNVMISSLAGSALGEGLFSMMVAGASFGKFIAAQVVTGVTGTAIIFGAVMFERHLLRRDSGMRGNEFYADMNGDELEPNVFWHKPDKPSDLSDWGEVFRQAGKVKKYDELQGEIDALGGMSRKEVRSSAEAKALLEKIQTKEHSGFQKRIPNLGEKRKMIPEMVQKVSAANQALKRKQVLKTVSQVGVFLLPLVGTYFSERARKKFAEAADADLAKFESGGEGPKIQAGTPLSIPPQCLVP